MDPALDPIHFAPPLGERCTVVVVESAELSPLVKGNSDQKSVESIAHLWALHREIHGGSQVGFTGFVELKRLFAQGGGILRLGL